MRVATVGAVWEVTGEGQRCQAQPSPIGAGSRSQPFPWLCPPLRQPPVFVEEAVITHTALAQTAEWGLGDFGELYWRPAMAGEVERTGAKVLALLSAS